MLEITDRRLVALKGVLSEEIFNRRVTEALAQSGRIEAILAAVDRGRNRAAAIREVCPGEVAGTWAERVGKWQRGGWQALVNRRYVKGPEKLTPQVQGLIHGMLEMDPTLRSEELAEKVEKVSGIRIGASTVRGYLREEELAQPRGRPHGGTRAEAHPLAGAELLLGVDLELGATASLTRDLQAELEKLPEPTGPLRDTSSNRDPHGRFESAYNEGQVKGESAVAPKFRSAEETRRERDGRKMRTANTSFEAFRRKVVSLTMLPAVTDSPHWSALRHWQGDHVGVLAGHAYQPATLEKFAGELKLGGLGEEALESVAAFWADPAKIGPEPVEGAVVLYADATTKPIWTHDFSRCAKVSSLGGRVMPATSTLALHAGCGTPLLYHSYSGQVSLPGQIQGLLRRWEELAGEGTARRMIVMDREAHAVWLFKALDPRWLYIVPLRTSVTGPTARFEELGEWAPYGESGDRTREGYLWLNDSRKGEKALRVRVVGRKRHRTGKVAWYATNTAQDQFGASAVIDLYFKRWPAQEHVFRDGSGRVGLNVHHGFGRRQVGNVAVLDRMEQLEGQIRKHEAAQAQALSRAAEVAEQHQDHAAAVAAVEARLDEIQQGTDEAVAAKGTETRHFRNDYQTSRVFQTHLPAMRAKAAELTAEHDHLADLAASANQATQTAKAELERRAAQTRIFTIDVELDQIMTAFKLTFMNLAIYFMAHYLGGKKVQLDTLIRAVLTLPGERVRTSTTETIRIYRQARDREFMPLVEEACRLLTAKRLTRNKRRLIYHVVDHPAGHPVANSGK
jgi:hypothetical protein